MKRLMTILVLAMIGAQAHAAKIDPKDEQLIKGTAVNMAIAKRCQIVLPTKAAATYKILYAVMDRKMFTAALAKADADISELFEKLGKEKFCLLGRQLLEKTWSAIPDDPLR